LADRGCDSGVQRLDLVWHECEFRDGNSFTYAVDEVGHGYIGCAYLSPVGRRRPLTETQLAHDVSWWVTPDAFNRGLYAECYAALRHWVTRDYPFANPLFSNAQLPD
jgi:hypothetical protein